MWPGKHEALSRTVEAEEAVRDLYAEAIRRWAPEARAVVLPALTASVLPPDPQAMSQTQSVWDQHAEEIVMAGLGVLWAVAAYETATGMGQALAATVTATIPPTVLGIVLASVLLNRHEVVDAVSHVESTPALKASRDAYLDQRRPIVAATPHRVEAKMTAALAEPRLTMSIVPEDRPEVLRTRAAEMLAANSPELWEVATVEGYQAAGLMNHAVMATAQQSPEAPDLQKTWICTIDGKTRPSHFASDGARVPLAGMFTVGGAQLAYPGDPTGPAAEVANCRCRMGILAKDEPLPDEVDRHTERLDGRDSVAINRHGRTQAEEIERRAKEGNVRARDSQDGVGRVASAGWAAPSEQENTMNAASDTTDAESYLTFTNALFAVTGTPTSDRRVLAPDIELTFRSTPMPLQWCERAEGGHNGSVTVGVIEAIRFENGEIRADGYMLNNEHAAKAIDLVSHGVCNPSIDFMAEVVRVYEDGTPVTEDNFDPDKIVLERFIKGEVMATTIVAVPAFGQTRIELNAQREPRAKALVASTTASFMPRVYDPALFADPKLSGPTHLTITEDGHIFGHVACWNEKHRSVGLGHVNPPRSNSGYTHFHSSPPVHLTDGTLLPVGRLTVGIGHAPTVGISNAAAQVHYDNVEACFALVRAGEDEHGIWVSGVPAPWASPEKVQMGLAAPMSGDWRPYGNQLDLVAVLAVNTPGFLCRAAAAVGSSQAPLAMVASFSPLPQADGGIQHLSAEAIQAIVVAGVAEERRNWELAERRKSVLARAQADVGDPPTPPTRQERLALLLERV